MMRDGSSNKQESIEELRVVLKPNGSVEKQCETDGFEELNKLRFSFQNFHPFLSLALELLELS